MATEERLAWGGEGSDDKQTDKTQETPSPAREGKEGKEQPEIPVLQVPSPHPETPWPSSPEWPGLGLGVRPAPYTRGAGHSMGQGRENAVSHLWEGTQPMGGHRGCPWEAMQTSHQGATTHLIPKGMPAQEPLSGDWQRHTHTHTHTHTHALAPQRLGKGHRDRQPLLEIGLDSRPL